MPVMRFYQTIGKLLTAALQQINQQCKKLTKNKKIKACTTLQFTGFC